jgi:hypothetical protein
MPDCQRNNGNLVIWFHITVILVVLTIPVSATLNHSDYPEKWKVLHDKNWSVSYPPEWVLHTMDNTSWVRISPPDDQISFDMGATMASGSVQYLIDDLSRYVVSQGSTIINNTTFSRINGREAAMFDYQGRAEDPGFCRAVYINNDGIILVIFYHADREQWFAENLDIAQMMIGTISFPEIGTNFSV